MHTQSPISAFKKNFGCLLPFMIFFLPTFIFPIKQGQTKDFKLARAGIYRKKKIKIGIHIVLKNYKYSKLLFLNTLRCNYLPTKTNKNKIMSFFNTKLAKIFFFLVEVRAFTLVVLKILALTS